MIGKQLYICDAEPVYLKRLASYLNRHSEFLWRIKTYTRLEDCVRERPGNPAGFRKGSRRIRGSAEYSRLPDTFSGRWKLSAGQYTVHKKIPVRTKAL